MLTKVICFSGQIVDYRFFFFLLLLSLCPQTARLLHSSVALEMIAARVQRSRTAWLGSYNQSGETHSPEKTHSWWAGMMADGGKKKERVRKRLGEFKRELKIQRGELLSESGGQTCSCHLISGNDITADFSLSVLLPLHHFTTPPLQER